MAGPRPMLTFKMRLPEKPESKLILGMLYLQLENNVQQQFSSTSGLPGWQFKEAQLLAGKGPLPASALRKEQLYMVKTAPIRMTDPAHASSKFYSILPEWIKFRGVERGSFGVHRDLNSPGTAGCIGIPEMAQWMNFMEAMERLKGRHLDDIPLAVIYH